MAGSSPVSRLRIWKGLFLRINGSRNSTPSRTLDDGVVLDCLRQVIRDGHVVLQVRLIHGERTVGDVLVVAHLLDGQAARAGFLGDSSANPGRQDGSETCGREQRHQEDVGGRQHLGVQMCIGAKAGQDAAMLGSQGSQCRLEAGRCSRERDDILATMGWIIYITKHC